MSKLFNSLRRKVRRTARAAPPAASRSPLRQKKKEADVKPADDAPPPAASPSASPANDGVTDTLTLYLQATGTLSKPAKPSPLDEIRARRQERRMSAPVGAFTAADVQNAKFGSQEEMFDTLSRSGARRPSGLASSEPAAVPALPPPEASADNPSAARGAVARGAFHNQDELFDALAKATPLTPKRADDERASSERRTASTTATSPRVRHPPPPHIAAAAGLYHPANARDGAAAAAGAASPPRAAPAGADATAAYRKSMLERRNSLTASMSRAERQAMVREALDFDTIKRAAAASGAAAPDAVAAAAVDRVVSDVADARSSYHATAGGGLPRATSAVRGAQQPHAAGEGLARATSVAHPSVNTLSRKDRRASLATPLDRRMMLFQALDKNQVKEALRAQATDPSSRPAPPSTLAGASPPMPPPPPRADESSATMPPLPPPPPPDA